jgi:hypothetical protein
MVTRRVDFIRRSPEQVITGAVGRDGEENEVIGDDRGSNSPEEIRASPRRPVTSQLPLGRSLLFERAA